MPILIMAVIALALFLGIGALLLLAEMLETRQESRTPHQVVPREIAAPEEKRAA